MSASLKTLDVQVFPEDPSQFLLAAHAIAFPLLEGSISYSDAVAALVRSAIRCGFTEDLAEDELQDLQGRIEWLLNRAVVAMTVDAVDAIRDGLAVPIARRAEAVILEQVALTINSLAGHALPVPCVRFLVAQELVLARMGVARA